MILPMRNMDESPVTFSIEPAELLHAYNLAENKGLEVIGIFHSHPARPWPSSTRYEIYGDKPCHMAYLFNH